MRTLDPRGLERTHRFFVGSSSVKAEPMAKVEGRAVDPVHQCLLHAGIPFAQVTTNLDRLARGAWWVEAFPLKLVDGTGAPVRVFAAAA